MRIVSLLPSATESLFRIGAGDLLVGRSHECDFPTVGGLARLPVLTAAATDQALSAAEIDRSVREATAQSLPLYTLNADLLARLRPDLILTQDLCDVCSIDLAAVERVAAALEPRPAILSLNPTTLEDMLDDLLAIGRAAGRTESAALAVTELRSRLWRAQEFVNPYTEGPVVGFLEWTDPLFVAGHWNVQLIERAGARHPLNPGVPTPTSGAAAGPQMAERRAGKSVRVPEDAFAATKPEFIVIAPCGLGLERTRTEARALAAKKWWSELPAVREGRVALVDGNAMFNRPGPRLIDAFEWLTAWINDRPELMPRDFPWEPLAR